MRGIQILVWANRHSYLESIENMKPLQTVLICDDDQAFHLNVKFALKGSYELRSAYNADEALIILKGQTVDVLLLDIQMRTPDEGIQYLPRFREISPDTAIIMASGLTDFISVSESLKNGATDYIPKDFSTDDLRLRIQTALKRNVLVQDKQRKDFEIHSEQKRHQLVGNAPAIQTLLKQLEKLKRSPANVLITGETGVGKEVVARNLRGSLPDGGLAPFVSIDSATIQSSTAESLLFGHEKGAFTGADKATKGIFEEANGGTVYFDEIGNMPLEIQAKLLRVLQEKEIRRMGASKSIELEFRVVAATNKDLEEMCRKGEFKDDLLQRINVLPVHIPPLRERSEDIPLLTHYLSQRHCTQGRRIQFTPEALDLLALYDWPGNIRELSNTIAYIVAMADSDLVDVADLPPKLRDRVSNKMKDKHSQTSLSSANGTQKELTPELNSDESFYSRISKFEKTILETEYQILGGNISNLALKLGMDRSHLYTKLKEHGIHDKKGRVKT